MPRTVRGDPTLAEAGDGWTLESKRLDQRRDIVRQDVEGHRTAAVPGASAPAGVRRDHAKVRGECLHVRGIGDRNAGPQRVGRDHSAVQEDERVTLALLEVVDVDAVGVDGTGLGCCLCGHATDVTAGGSTKSSGVRPKFLPAS